jgi:hypothetical protein
MTSLALLTARCCLALAALVSPAMVATVNAAAIQSLTASPLSVQSDTPTNVTVTVRFDSDPTLIPSSIQLLQYDERGQLVARLGQMLLDGEAYTRQILVNETGPKVIVLRVSAAYLQRLTRLLSPPLFIPIAIHQTPVDARQALAAALRSGDLLQAYRRLGQRLTSNLVLDSLDTATLQEVAAAVATCSVESITDVSEVCIAPIFRDGSQVGEFHFYSVRDALGLWRVTGW